MTKIAASIMCANPFYLAQEIAKCEEAKIDLFHCDVMDGIYVNNLALYPEYLTALSKKTSIPLDIHLATITPFKYIEMFKEAKPEYISFHIEVVENVREVIQKLREYGIKPSIAVNPETPIASIFPYIEEIDMILLMTVNPGFAGQAFQHSTLEKLRLLKEELKHHKNQPLIEVDGNINAQTVAKMKDFLPDIFVLGTSALFHEKDETSYEQRARNIFSKIGETV
jgi:ribulose-phosphate 3-epimerase